MELAGVPSRPQPFCRHARRSDLLAPTAVLVSTAGRYPGVELMDIHPSARFAGSSSKDRGRRPGG